MLIVQYLCPKRLKNAYLLFASLIDAAIASVQGIMIESAYQREGVWLAKANITLFYMTLVKK